METVRRVAGLGAMALLLAASGSSWAQQQPIEFSHNLHVAQGLECIDCHITVDTRDEASIPSVSQCMLCHEKVAVDGPGVRKLREYAGKKREVPWIRIYAFNRSGHVTFRHAPHARAGVECVACHGNVAEMTVVTRQVEHHMGTCLNCHRQQRATEDCAACHF